MKRILHPIAGGIALATISIFWLSTLLSELFGGIGVVTTVKTSIPWGFLILIPALIAAGGSGFQMSRKMRGPLVAKKQKRMPFIAANGILILIPSALYLSFKAQAGTFDTGFYAVQALELLAGAANITLLGLNMRDGFRLTRRRRPTTDAHPKTD